MRSEMSSNKKYRCVNCGEPSSALYKTYGPTVLKLTKCVSCKGIVDKYIEYDPVIVMIDLVLMSKEAQRHILYNTEFKAYWKLLIILMMLETYAVWRKDCLFSLVVNMLCNNESNYTIDATSINIPLSVSLPESWRHHCRGWQRDSPHDDTDLFIWEKDFYVQFLSTFVGIVVFIITVHILMKFVQLFGERHPVSCELLLKAFSLGNASAALALPALVWRSKEGAGAGAHAAHYALAALYTLVFFYNVFTVVYVWGRGRGRAATLCAVWCALCGQQLCAAAAAPPLRALLA
ncbi:PREDICTED: protein ARV1 [Papilio polytes]|uniref:protein ARV1 n=1 Tax=Papilio polytes TaxID=76194 RepID=UPI00067694EA|nr:PREDICTED: protein ARV1 [Papilio polytes]